MERSQHVKITIRCARQCTRHESDRLKETTKERQTRNKTVPKGQSASHSYTQKIRGSGTYTVSARVSVMCPCEPTAQHRSHHQGVGHTLRLILYRAMLNTQEQTDAFNTLQILISFWSLTLLRCRHVNRFLNSFLPKRVHFLRIRS